MKTPSTLFLPLAALSLASCGGQKKEEAKQPNIIFMMTDDHTTQAMSCYGGNLIQTPNMDRIANEGIRFDNCYAVNALSGPSRACILTGKFSHENGFTDNASTFNGDQQTFPKLLQQAGYQTAMIGKWHLISEPQGFDHWSILSGQHEQGDYYDPDFWEDGKHIVEKGYATDIITDKAIKFLEGRDKSKPFCMMYHQKAPHRNWMPAPRYLGIFNNTTFPEPANLFDDYEGRKAAQKQKMNIYRDMYEGHDLKMNVAKGSDSLRFDPWKHLNRRMTPEQWKRFNDNYREKNNSLWERDLQGKDLALWKYQRYAREYMATIASLDESIGKTLDYLKKEGLLDNTIIVYCSDQGFYVGEHGWFDKRFMYEESMKMPMMMRFPPKIKAGTHITKLTQNIDFAPTFLEMCGIDVPKEMQGVSFLPLLEGKKTPDWIKYLYYHFYEFPGFHSVHKHYGVKGERYKLMYFYQDKEWELYDMKNDPMEMHNIYGRKGTEKITAELKKELTRLQQQYKVPQRCME